mgnify:CR=1
LNVRFPTIFEVFTEAIAASVNLDALKLAKADCLMKTNFYSKLVISTLGPIILSLAILLSSFVLKAHSKSKESKAHINEGASALFLTLTYMVF